MEVNKEQAELCRDRGAQALRSGDYARSVKMLEKSLRLYPLGGVEALLAHAKAKLEGNNSSSTNGNSTPSSPPTSAANGSNTNGNNTGSDGRPYTDAQVQIVQTILRAKQTGRQAHYRVLGIEPDASESDIKKAYRKRSLKVHPDKNSAPQADDAFKAVSLAYATLSDENKRVIYDRYGDEDPDNRGGGGRGGMHMRHGGQDVSPEDIFNAFFGHMNGMPGGAGGGPGVHFYTNGFGPGMHFQAGGPRGRQRNAQDAGGDTGFSALLKLLPFLLMLIFSLSGSQGSGSKYEGQYFTLAHNPPFTVPVATQYTKVTDIPYFITPQFQRTYFKDLSNRRKIEEHVEKSYQNYLVRECDAQKDYRRRLVADAERTWSTKQREQKMRKAKGFELTRCDELKEFFPNHQRRSRY